MATIGERNKAESKTEWADLEDFSDEGFLPMVDEAFMTEGSRRSLPEAEVRLRLRLSAPLNQNRSRPSLDVDPGSAEEEFTLCAPSLSAITPQGMEDHTTDAGSITPRSLGDDEASAPYGSPAIAPLRLAEPDNYGAMDESALDAIRRERMEFSLANSSNALASFSVKNTFLSLAVNAIVPSLVRSKSAPGNQGRSINESEMADCSIIGSMEGSAATEEVQFTIPNQTSIGRHPHELVPLMYGGMFPFAASNQLLACSTMDAEFQAGFLAAQYGSMPCCLPDNSWFGGGPMVCSPSQYGQPFDAQQARLLSNGIQPHEETEAHRIHEIQIASLVVLPHAFRPQTVMRCAHDGVLCIRWTVDAKKLRGHDKGAVSPLFELSDGSLGASLPFKMVITPKVSGVGKGGGSFRMANGKAMVQLKCEAPRDDLASSPMTFWLSAGGGGGSQAFQVPRGPVQHDFAQSGMRGLPKDVEIWDLNGLLDETSQTFVVCLAVLSPWH